MKVRMWFEQRQTRTDRFEEKLENTTGLFVDETRDTLDTTTTSKTTNGLCIALKMIIGH